jgi:hypothetical protein
MSPETSYDIPARGTFPPYGFMNKDDMSVVMDESKPDAWRDSQKSYDDWFDCTLKTIQRLLWPIFDDKSKAWVGNAKSSMLALTVTDLTAMRKLYVGNPEAIDFPVDAPIGAQPLKTHHELFSEEDLLVTNWGSSYATYDKTLTDAQVKSLVAIITDAYSKKVGSSLLRIKHFLRRPRAYQMASLLGFDDFTYYEALSADTPSMCHGHCAQGLLLVGAVMERILLSGDSFGHDNWRALEQFAVDIGDRRVLARVHYPSDLLSSWYIVMGMAEHVFATLEVKKHLWSAISNRSHMYRLIVEEKSPLYMRMLEVIRVAALEGFSATCCLEESL